MLVRQAGVFFFILFFQLIRSQTSSDSFSIQTISEVVVTGSITPESARQSVYQIRSIGQDQIKLRGAVRIQDVLATETNIRFNQDLATGNSNMSMQGIAGQNVKILIDGIPMVGRQGTNNEINLNQIDINTIARIEVVEGPMSVIYGADALAGVINIITKKAIEGKADLAIKIQEETVHTEYGWPAGIHQYAINGGFSKGDVYIKGNLARNGFGGFTGTAIGRDYQWHPKTQYLTGMVLGIDKNRFKSHYRLDYTNEDIFNPGIPTASIANDQNYLTSRWMHQWQSDVHISDKLKLNTAIGYTFFKRQVQATTFNEETNDRRLSIAPGAQDTSVFNGLTLRMLMPLRITNWFSFLPGIDINVESGKGGRLSTGSHTIQDYGIIFSGDLKLTDRLSLKPGLRLIYNSVYDAPAGIPSLNLKWDVHPSQVFKFAYGRGFRAPSLRELYFSFFDSNHAVIGNTNLRSELSHSLSGSWSWQIKNSERNKLDFSINAFYNTIQDLINFGQSPSNPQEVTYINIDHYKTKGFTTSLQARSHHLSFLFTAGYTGRYNQFNASDKSTAEFVWSPEASLSASYTFIKQKLTIGLFQKYTGKTPYFESILVDGTQSIRQSIFEDYSWTDISMNKNINSKIQLSAGVRNLFNIQQIISNSISPTGVHTPGNNQSIGYGRSAYLGIHYSIIK